MTSTTVLPCPEFAVVRHLHETGVESAMATAPRRRFSADLRRRLLAAARHEPRVTGTD